MNALSLTKSPLIQRHSDPSLNLAWATAQVGLFVFFLWPAPGGVLLGFSLLATWWRHLGRIVRQPMMWGWLGLGLWLALTCVTAYRPVDAWLGLANFLPFFIFFATYSRLLQTAAQLRHLAWILAAGGVVVVALGLGQLVGLSTSETMTQILGWRLHAGGNPVTRAASVFMYANILAAYLLVLISLCVGLLIDERRRGGHRGRQIFLGVLLFFGVVTLLLTSSRNAWAIALLEAIVFSVYCGWRWVVGVVGAIGGAVGLAAFGPLPLRTWLRWIVPVFVWGRLTDQSFPNRPSATLRSTQWLFARQLTTERPWLGWGLRNFTPLYEAKTGFWLGHPHNLLLMLSAETGIPATLAFCALVAWPLAQVGRYLLAPERWLSNLDGGDRAVLFAYGVGFGAIALFNLLDVTLFDLRMNLVGWLLLACLNGLVLRQRAIARDSLETPGSLK